MVGTGTAKRKNALQLHFVQHISKLIQKMVGKPVRIYLLTVQLAFLFSFALSLFVPRSVSITIVASREGVLLQGGVGRGHRLAAAGGQGAAGLARQYHA